jgi:hypothetical protein
MDFDADGTLHVQTIKNGKITHQSFTADQMLDNDVKASNTPPVKMVWGNDFSKAAELAIAKYGEPSAQQPDYNRIVPNVGDTRPIVPGLNKA